MKEEPCSLIIAPMPDTKHRIMYWKPPRTDTHLLKVSSKKPFDGLKQCLFPFNVRWNHFLCTAASAQTLN